MMMSYASCSEPARTSLIVALHIVHCVLTLLIIMKCRRKAELRSFYPSLTIFACVLYTTIIFIAYDRSLESSWVYEGNGLIITEIPYFIFVFILFLIFAYCIWDFISEEKIAQSNLSEHSVRFAVDNLPIGFCVFDTEGMPVLTNRRTYKLCADTTGGFYRNGHEFWEGIVNPPKGIYPHPGTELLEKEPYPVLCYPDGSIWQFSKESLTLNGRQYFQILASDITEFYALTIDLAEENLKLKNQQERLKRLSEDIVSSTREEEILNSKIKVHGLFGESLLAARKYLIGNEKADALKEETKEAKEVIDRWKNVIKFMETPEEILTDKVDNTVKELVEAGEIIGCEIIFSGTPMDEVGYNILIFDSIREAMLNAVRHGEANKLFVEVSNSDNKLNLVISNNGKVPISPIIEGGGLSFLRHSIEKEGGAMKIIVTDKVKLYIELPKNY